MRIGFYHIDTNTPQSAIGHECARLMVRSAKRVMPTVPVIHFTDGTSRSVKGVDAVYRKPAEPMALLRMRHHAGVQGDWLFVDTDIIFQASVKYVFKAATWDLGVTTRNWTHVKPAAGFSERMPYNMGVVFSRCPQFWSEVYLRLKVLEPEKQRWMGDQEAFCATLAEPWRPYEIRMLKGSRYNYPPMLPEDVPNTDQMQAEAAILHYKGERRKPLLLKGLKQEARCA